MQDDPFEKLTEKQRTCLRLVAQHLNSKEIARELGVSVPAVEQRLKYATRTLGARDRREAARLLARHEEAVYGRTIYGSAVVAQPAGMEQQKGSEAGEQPASVAQRARLEDVRAVYDPAISPEALSWASVPLPGRGRSPDDFNGLRRTAWIVGIMLATVLAFGTFVSGVEALSRIAAALN